jgi:AhpD family alkylhydroperoxidase
MEFHGVDVGTQFKRMRELAPESYRAFLDFDKQAFKDGAAPGKTKELIALGIAQITQCPWCIQAHTKKAATAGAFRRRDRRDHVRGHGHGGGGGVEPRRAGAAVPAGAQERLSGEAHRGRPATSGRLRSAPARHSR